MSNMNPEELADLYEMLSDLRDLIKSRNEDIDMLAEALESAVYSLETAETNASIDASWPEKARHALEHVNSETDNGAIESGG
jgi:hypothetical protein